MKLNVMVKARIRCLIMVKKYMKDSWQVDLDLLRKVIARRTNEISELDLDHIY